MQHDRSDDRPDLEDATHSRLSALADGEVPSREAGALLERIVADDQLKAAWQRYHVMRAVLRDEYCAVPADFAADVRAQIDREPTVLAPRRLPNLVRPATGIAIAASVAAMAIVGVDRMQSASRDDALAGQVAYVTPSLPVAQPLQVAPPVQVVDWQGQTIQSQRLNSYIMNFNEARSDMGVPVGTPHVRIVGYENAQPAP